MGESVTEMLQFLCRLCARTDKSCVNVFSSDGDKFFIQKKIRLCLPVIVEEQDEMPRQICLSCLNKLESTYEFYTTCIYAQSTIKRLLKAKSLQDSDNVNKPSSEMKENIPTSFSLDQYLKRKIDPVDAGKSSKVQKTDKPDLDLTNNNVHVETTKVLDSEVNTASGNSNGSTVNTDKSEFQSASTCGSNNTSLVATNNLSATSAETHKPKLRVRTTSELREAGQTSTVTDCVSALLSLQNPTAQSASVPTTRQSTSVSASHLTSVVYSQSATPQSSRTTSSFPLHVKNPLRINVKNSSALNGGTSWSPVAQSAKIRSPAVQLSKNSSAPQSIRSSPSVLTFSTSSSSALQTATNSLFASQNGTTLLSTPKNPTVSLPMPNNSTAPVTVANNATVSRSLPQNVTNSPSLQQYSLSVPTSGCPILPKVSQFIIVPNTFATTPTFTAAGTNTVTVLAQALPSNMSLVRDLSVPLGTATTLVAPQSTQPPLPGSVQPLTISTTAAVPLASSSLPVVQTVPIQVTQKLPNPVMTPLTSAPAVINQASTSSSVAFSVLNRNKDIVITSNARVTVTTSTASVSTKSKHSKLSQNLKVSSSSPVSSTSNAPAARVSTEGRTVGSRSDTVVQSAGTTASTVSSKQNSSAQPRANVTVSRAASHPIILPKPAAPVVTSAKNIQSNSSSILQSHLIYTVPNSKNSSLIKPAKTPSQGSSSRHSDIPKTVLCYPGQLATKANCLHSDKRMKAPSQASIPQTTVVTSVSTGNPSFSISVGPAQQLKEGARSVIIQKKNTNSVGNTQPPTTSLVSSVKNESQFSENQTQQKAVTPRPQPSGGLPPPPLAVPLNSVSENRRKLANNECADLQKREATSKSGHQVSRENSQRQSMKDLKVSQKSCISNQAKSELTPKPRGPVATATVTPFNTTSRPASDPQGQSPRGPSPELEVEPLSPSSDSTTARRPGKSSNSSPAAAEQKEECPYCHVEFPADILIHHKTLHYREKFYSCIDCDKNFVTEKGLESHRCQKESKG